MIFDCFKFLFNGRKEKFQYWDESKDFEFSSTVYLQTRMMINTIERSEITTDPEDVEAYPLNLKSIQLTTPRDFCDIFRLSYQKCLYGPLTYIPRPLNYVPSEIIITVTIETIKTSNIVSIKVCNEGYFK